MLLSMTGFAARTFHVTVQQETVTITMTVKSLNSRFFEANCKMPHALAHLENSFVKKLRTALYRGTIYSTVHVSSLAPLQGPISPCLRTIEGYLKALRQIQEKFGEQFQISGHLAAQDILQLPHVFDVAEQHLDQATGEEILRQMDLVIADLVKEREREGAELGKDVLARIQDADAAIVLVEARAKVAIKEREKRLTESAQEFLRDASPEARDQQMQQIFIQLEKMDIHEEIVRFKTHSKSLQDTLADKSDEKGKKLDFVLQELFREINTMSAKCSDPELSSLAIRIKVALEKAREQTQNIV